MPVVFGCLSSIFSRVKTTGPSVKLDIGISKKYKTVRTSTTAVTLPARNVLRGFSGEEGRKQKPKMKYSKVNNGLKNINVASQNALVCHRAVKIG